MASVWKDVYTSAINSMVPHATQEVYQLVVKEAIKLVKANHGSIFIIKEKQPKRVYSSYSALYDVTARPSGKIYRAYHTGKPYLIENPKDSDHPEFKTLGIKSGIGMPLIYGHITIGVLSILSKSSLTLNDVAKLQLYVPLATLAVRKAYLYEELNKAIEARDTFMSLASHELKTPLTVIGAYNELLLRSLENKEHLKYATKISNELYRIRNLIEEFLHIDSHNKGKLNYKMKVVNIDQLIQEAIESYTKTVSHRVFVYKKKLPENIRLDKKVKADSQKVLQVMFNLLNNAVKFSPKDSTIKVTLEFNNYHYIVSVYDQGVGIPKEDVENLFTRFYKGTSDKPGMGLGLYLSKQIIEDHKGKILIQSRVNRGTKVQFTLPACKSNV